jgi:hypothetical protein
MERVKGLGTHLSCNENGGTDSFVRAFNGMRSGEQVDVVDRMTLYGTTYMKL